MIKKNKRDLLTKKYGSFIVFLDYFGHAPESFLGTDSMVEYAGPCRYKDSKRIGQWFNHSRGKAIIFIDTVIKEKKLITFMKNGFFIFNISAKSLIKRLDKKAIYFSDMEILEKTIETLNYQRIEEDKVVVPDNVKKELSGYPIKKT